MATEVLMSISQNEAERARFMSRKKFQMDLLSDMRMAKEVGEIEGEAKGKAEEQGDLRMAADFEAVMQASKRYADDVRRAMPVDKAVLFGSYAKGTADKLSDVDICFFLDNYGGKQRTDIIGELLRLISGHKAFFEPIAFPTSEIYNDNPFVKEILRTGKEIS